MKNTTTITLTYISMGILLGLTVAKAILSIMIMIGS